MSHELEIVDGKANMAYVGETPWHKLGTKCNPDVTPEEMQKAAGLDNVLDPHPIFVEIGGKKVKIKNKQAWVRSTDGKIMTIASDGWQPTQNTDVFKFFKDYCAAGGATLETAGSLRGGSYVWALANLQDGFTVGGKKDRVNGYLLFTTPHKVGSSISVRTTSVRVVCANTMAMAERNSTMDYKQNHMSAFNFDKAKLAVENAHECLRNAAKRANTLFKLKLSIEDSMKALAPIFDVPEDVVDLQEYANTKPKSNFAGVIRSMLTAPGALPGNAWGTLQGVTHYFDHEAGRHANARMWRSALGDAGKFKLDTEAKLLEMAA